MEKIENLPGYPKFCAAYKSNLSGLKMWYLKHIRRYGKVTAHILELDTASIKQTWTFILDDPKKKEGKTFITRDGHPSAEYQTIFTAWDEYEKALIASMELNQI